MLCLLPYNILYIKNYTFVCSMHPKIYTLKSPKCGGLDPFFDMCLPMLGERFPIVEPLWAWKNEAKGCHPQGWWFGCAFGKVFLGALFVEAAGNHGEKKTYGKDQKSDLGNHGIHHRGSDLCWHSELEHLENMIRREQGGGQPPISWLEGFWQILLWPWLHEV